MQTATLQNQETLCKQETPNHHLQEEAKHHHQEDAAAVKDELGQAAADEAILTNYDVRVASFEDMGMPMDVLRSVYGAGFDNPSVIQMRAIPALVAGHDTIAIAHSGTGKTLSFGAAACSLVDTSVRRRTQVVVLSPTRDLALQTCDVIADLGARAGVATVALVGKTSVRAGIQALRDGAHIAVGTPGRVLHMLNDGHIRGDDVRMLVVDEADELLSMGFADQLYDIMQAMPENVQVALFSATWTEQAGTLADRFMRKPVRIMLKQEKVTLAGIAQYYVNVETRDNKFPCLIDLHSRLSATQSVIFCNSRRSVEMLADEMTREKHAVSFVHADIDPADRTERVRAFKRGDTRVLIATDVLARGIDAVGVSLVINYELPFDDENYVHRIGRSGRFGRKGVAINIVVDDDTRRVRELEARHHCHFDELPGNVEDLLKF